MSPDPSSADDIVQMRSNRVLMLTARNSLYQAVLRHDGDSGPLKDYKTALRYSLSRDVDPDRSQRYALMLVEDAIRSGSLQTARVISDALPSPNAAGDEQAFLLIVAFQIATKRYEDALAALDKAPRSDWSTSEIANVYRAIALNRCRKHVEANALLGDLLQQSNEPELVSVLGAIQIAGLMHLGQVEVAQRAFGNLVSLAEGANNEGYILRNGAAAFPTPEALVRLQDARAAFEREGDAFGAGTCLANIGAIHANSGKFGEASAALIEALSCLSAYGFGHMEEALCNVAFLELRAGNHQSAAHRLHDMLQYSQPNMPRLYALDHMALLEALAGRHDKAQNYMDEGDTLCAKVPVPVAQIRHRLNTVLLRRFVRDPQASLASLDEVDAAAQGQNKVVADDIARKIRSVWETPTRDDVLNTYSPGFLEYWSFDALGSGPIDFRSAA